MPYIGRSTEAFGVRSRFTFLASADDTSVSGNDVNGLPLKFNDGAYVDVFLNGVRLKHGTDYVTTTANTIGSLAALAANKGVACDGAAVGGTATVGANDVYVEAIYGTAAFTAGEAKLVIEYIEP